jgi:adenosylmethionine-8-amino-7-oxononanoate aminotransferase
MAFILTLDIGTPPLVRSLCPNRWQTGFGIRTDSGSMVTHIWCVLITLYLLVLIDVTPMGQAHPLSCAAAIAVQKVIGAENLLENGRQTGEYLAKRLRERLQSPNALAQPFVFDVRGGGSFWAIEFDLTGREGRILDLKGERLAMVVQGRCLEKGLIVMGMTGGANIEGTEGDHIIISPAYNITYSEVDRVVDIFVDSLEEVLSESEQS